MQTIADMEVTGYSNYGASSQGSAGATTSEKSEAKQTPVSDEQVSEGGNTSEESGTLENTQEQEALDNSTESNEGSSAEESQKQDQGKTNGKKGQKGIDKRFGELTREKAQLKAQADYWRELAMKSQAPPAQNAAPAEKVETKKSDDGKPDKDNFGTNAEYIDALADWKFEQLSKASEEKAKKSQQEQSYAEKVKKHNDRLAVFKQSTPEFDQVVRDFATANPTIQIGNQFAELIFDSEHSDRLTYELFKDPDLLIRLNSSDHATAARAIGRIESRIEHEIESKKASTQTVKTKTSAPPPLEPISGSNASASLKKPLYEIEDTEEFLKEWGAKNLKKRR